jgi:hypothetical protein
MGIALAIFVYTFKKAKKDKPIPVTGHGGP